MNLNKKIKINKKFDPLGQWYMLLLIISIIFLILIFYGVFSFFYIKDQISDIESESLNNTYVSTSTIKNKEIDNINKVLMEFDSKENIYNKLIDVSTMSTSTSIATSTQ